MTALVPERRFDSRRVYVALVFVPLFYALVRYAPAVGLFGLVALAALIAVTEFYRLALRTAQASPLIYLTGGAVTALLLITAQWPGLMPDRPLLTGISCEQLARDAAETTLMVLELQQWHARQSAADGTPVP